MKKLNKVIAFPVPEVNNSCGGQDCTYIRVMPTCIGSIGKIKKAA